LLVSAFNAYFEANIPVDYWFRDMHNFTGDKSLVKRYDELTSDVKQTYKYCKSVCFSGSHGVGKSLTCGCILKRVVETGEYSGLYLNMTDIIHVMTTANSEDKALARSQLMDVDFLVIDEVDQRFMGTDNAADLFGRILEPVIRGRIQNRLPLFFCTNSPKVVDSFTGPLKASITSLMKMVTVHPIISSKDARDQEGKK
jgi:DNA replication protein DnaC